MTGGRRDWGATGGWHSHTPCSVGPMTWVAAVKQAQDLRQLTNTAYEVAVTYFGCISECRDLCQGATEHLPHQTAQSPHISRPTHTHTHSTCTSSGSRRHTEHYNMKFHHFSVFREAAGLLLSGGSYWRRPGSSFPAGPTAADSENGIMNSTPPSFHSPAVSTKTDERLTLRWTNPQSLHRKLRAFYTERHPRLIYSVPLLLPLPSHQYLMEAPCSGELRLAIRSGAVLLQRGHSLCHYTHLVRKLERGGGTQ